MSNRKTDGMVRVVKTDQLHQRKLRKIARRYGVTPAEVRELQLGNSVDIHPKAAERMEQDGYVKRTRSKPRPVADRLNTLTTEDKTITETPEDGEVKLTTEEIATDDTTDPSVENEEQLGTDV